MVSAPEGTAPLDMVADALESTSTMFEDRRAHARKRQALLAAHADLRERELIKLSSLASAMAGALRLRGVAEPAASLAAETGMGVFKIAFQRWVVYKEHAFHISVAGEVRRGCQPPSSWLTGSAPRK